jgi:CRP/FNR family transcriptional regulator, dissimilatory nitrate respiration regulator
MSPPARLSPADIETACRVALFSGLTRASVVDLLDHASVRSYDRDSLLFSAADPADRFFVVVAGAVKLSVVDTETIIEIIGAGNSFAEAAMFGPGRFPVSAEAMAGARLITIEASSFPHKLEENRQLALDMLAALGRWQLPLMAELRQLKAHTPAQRLGWYLLRLADTSTGAARVKLPYRKSIIAAGSALRRKACRGHWPGSPSSGSKPSATRS